MISAWLASLLSWRNHILRHPRRSASLKPLTPQPETSQEICCTQDNWTTDHQLVYSPEDNTIWRHPRGSSVHRATGQPTSQSEDLLRALYHAGQLTQQIESLPGVLLHTGKMKPQSTGPPWRTASHRTTAWLLLWRPKSLMSSLEIYCSQGNRSGASLTFWTQHPPPSWKASHKVC